MADFLTRLLERTQGTIPARQLAQPVLHSTFAPSAMSVESPIELYEERDATGEITPLVKQPEQDRRRVLPSQTSSQVGQLSATTPMERPVVETFETPTNVEPVFRDTPTLSSQLQQPQSHAYREHGEPREHVAAHQEAIPDLMEEKMVEPSGYDISYSHDISVSQSVSASTSQPSSDSQADGTQPSQVHALNEKLDSSRMRHNMMGTEELKENTFEEHELLIKTQQTGVSIEQQTALPFMGLDDARAGSGKFEDSEESTFTENTVGGMKEHSQTLEREQQMHGLLLPQQHVIQNVVQMPAQKGSEQGIDTSSEQKLETLISQEEMHVASPLNVSPLYTSFVQASSNPLMNEQEHVERIVVTRPSQEEVTREAVLREESVRVQREVLLEAQEHIIEQIQQEQARRSGVSSQRRIIPTQGQVTRQEQVTGLSAKESMTPPVTQIVPPTIQVSIGRIEVRAVTAATPTPRPKPARPSPSLSLEEYLEQQRGGR